jgi:hypothetical protein
MSRLFEQSSHQPVTTPEAYSQAFLRKEPVVATGLCGRILRGKVATDFTTLTDDPKRKIVMLMGPDGLSKMSGKSGLAMLTEIGYTREYIAQKMAESTQFKLVIFPESKDAKPATWYNVIDLVSRAYPETAAALKRYHSQLANSRFDEIENQAGFSFAEVDANGSSDPRYMSFERFIASPQSLADTRAFLYFSAYLKELYSGDGYTYTPEGNRGLQEYITLNQPINALGKSITLDIPV